MGQLSARYIIDASGLSNRVTTTPHELSFTNFGLFSITTKLRNSRKSRKRLENHLAHPLNGPRLDRFEQPSVRRLDRGLCRGIPPGSISKWRCLIEQSTGSVIADDKLRLEYINWPCRDCVFGDSSVFDNFLSYVDTLLTICGFFSHLGTELQDSSL